MPTHRSVSVLIHDPEALRAARYRRGLSLSEAAANVGITKSFLGEIERGTRSMTRRPHLMVQLATLYRVPVREIERKRSA